MTIAIIQPIPDRQSYEAVNEKIFPGGMDEPPEGLIVHTAGQGPNGFRVVDVWESRETFERFANERVMPAMKEAGMIMDDLQRPEIIELMNVVVTEAARV